MAHQDAVTINGKVVKALPNAKFEVEVPGGQSVTASLSGKMRMNNIWVNVGDEVSLELSVYDLRQGRITYRYK
jgi:translation initiation factor IF-1